MADPLPICYLNGEFPLLSEARISPLDRGFLFADSVYEVLPAFAGRPFRFREHFDRLARSLREIGLTNPHTHAEWLQILLELLRRNQQSDLYFYVQVTRGSEYGRNHAFPAHASATVFAMASPLPVLTQEMRTQGISAITLEDFRWGRCHIKSTALLANVLMKQRASVAGAAEAILVRNGEVMEGSSTSVFAIVEGALVTPPNSNLILPGTTRDVVLELAREAGMQVQVRSLSTHELEQASEIWIAAATRDTLPVTRLNDQPVGTGWPGPQWSTMCDRFAALRQRLAGTPAL